VDPVDGAVALAVAAGAAPAAYLLLLNRAAEHGWWRLADALARPTPFVMGARGENLAFFCRVTALRETGRLDEAAAAARAVAARSDVTVGVLNTAIDVMISAGQYRAALAAAPPPLPADEMDGGHALIQINLAEAEYNLGRWDAAEARLRPLDGASSTPICRAGLLQQRAWIAVHGGRAQEAFDLCGRIKPEWLPAAFRAEYYFTWTVVLLAAGRPADAAGALAMGEKHARRLSSRRNALFLRARLAGARGDWAAAERYGRQAAAHPFRGQGGDGLLSWAHALRALGRDDEARDALRLAVARDPESAAAAVAAEQLAALSR
jgi:tetratricopeptide (TPR) repeat protein